MSLIERLTSWNYNDIHACIREEGDCRLSLPSPDEIQVEAKAWGLRVAFLGDILVFTLDPEAEVE